MSNIQIIICIASVLFLSACSKSQDHSAIAIDSVRMSSAEFDRLYGLSHRDPQNIESKKEFLDQTINRKLMLLEAERMGLDRDPQFLKEVQDFWQERLLKSVLSLKIREYEQNIQVSDEEIKSYFESHPQSFAGMNLDQTENNIRQILMRAKQHDRMDQWLKTLRQESQIKIDYDQLGIAPQ